MDNGYKTDLTEDMLTGNVSRSHLSICKHYFKTGSKAVRATQVF